MADTAADFRFVPDSYLVQLYPSMEGFRKIPHERAEIYPPLSAEVNHNTRAIERYFRSDDLHFKFMVGDFFASYCNGFSFPLAVAFGFTEVFFGGQPDDWPQLLASLRRV
jgi:hypothetical protein